MGQRSLLPADLEELIPEDHFVDGSKLEANAGRHSAVWAKRTQSYKEGLKQKIQELLEEMENANETEPEEYGDQDWPEVGKEAEIDSQRVKEKMDQLNERLRQRPKDKDLKKVRRELGLLALTRNFIKLAAV
jgi:hypothetical protein